MVSELLRWGFHGVWRIHSINHRYTVMTAISRSDLPVMRECNRSHQLLLDVLL